jgi:hypothetical protein
MARSAASPLVVSLIVEITTKPMCRRPTSPRYDLWRASAAIGATSHKGSEEFSSKPGRTKTAMFGSSHQREAPLTSKPSPMRSKPAEAANKIRGCGVSRHGRVPFRLIVSVSQRQRTHVVLTLVFPQARTCELPPQGLLPRYAVS